MFLNFVERYGLKFTLSRFSKMSELVSVRHANRREDIEKHIDRMAAIIEHIHSKGSSMEDFLSIDTSRNDQDQKIPYIIVSIRT